MEVEKAISDSTEYIEELETQIGELILFLSDPFLDMATREANQANVEIVRCKRDKLITFLRKPYEESGDIYHCPLCRAP